MPAIQKHKFYDPYLNQNFRQWTVFHNNTNFISHLEPILRSFFENFLWASFRNNFLETSIREDLLEEPSSSETRFSEAPFIKIPYSRDSFSEEFFGFLF